MVDGVVDGVVDAAELVVSASMTSLVLTHNL